MPVKIFVFNRNQSIAQNLRIIVVSSYNPALQRERANDASLIVIEFSNRTRPIVLEILNLWQISGVDEQKPGRRPYQSGSEHEQGKEDPAENSLAGNLDFRLILKE
jgi:hypothetical protein